MFYNQSTSYPLETLCGLADSHPDAATSRLPALLTASVAVLAVDATVHLFRWRSQEKIPIPVSSSSPNTPTTHPPLRQFVAKAEEILGDFRELEMQLASENARCQTLNRPSHQKRQRVITYSGKKGDVCQGLAFIDELRKDRTTNAFGSFCERLLLMNRIWKQEKQMKELRTSLKSETKSKNNTAFKTFCDQLLLWNRIWKLEKEVKTLVAEGEKMKRSRVMAITRAAKQMVLDVQKERLVEEFAKDLIDETEERKREVESLRELHEKEIKEMNGDWLKAYRGVVKELNALKMAQEARLLEQEMANDLEHSLYENMRVSQRKVAELEEKISVYEKRGYASSSDDTIVASTPKMHDARAAAERDFDSISELSSSSTCVSSSRGQHNGRSKRIIPGSQRKRCISNGSFRSPHERCTTAASSLKHLIIGHPRSMSTLETNLAASTRTCNHSGRPLAVRNRTTSFRDLHPITEVNALERSSVLAKRAPWR